MAERIKRINYIFLIYWFLLAYIIAALVWWFIALNRQNHQMAILAKSEVKATDRDAEKKMEIIRVAEKRKTAQYIGEGSIFFMLIAAGAVFVYRAVRRQLKQSQQQQNFMMAVTHELKTPIAVAKLNLETLQKRKLDDVQQQRLIQTTLQEANRMNALCNNLLLSSQMEAGGYKLMMQEISFSELVSGCVNDFIIRFPQRQLVASIKEDVFVNGDPQMLQIAVNNLLDNAIKYSPKESAIRISLEEKDNKITLQVADNGKGISDEEKHKVFDKFYRSGNTATRNAKGTGLGLYLTRKILQQHKANIFVTDNNPAGCIFTVELHSFENVNDD